MAEDPGEMAGIKRALTAILMLLVQEAQVTDDNRRVKPRSVEALLYEAGFPQIEIVTITNKSKQTVSARLKADGLT